MSQDFTVSRVTDAELAAVRDFCGAYWGSWHPLIQHTEMFDYYYRREDGIHMVYAAAEDGALLAVCGWISASEGPAQDLWLSFLLARPGAPFGMTFALIDAIRDLTGCRAILCNNIRPETCGIYRFLGWETAEMTRMRLLNPLVFSPHLAEIRDRAQPELPASEDTFFRLRGPEQLAKFDFERFRDAVPWKDRAYVVRRYFENPWLDYRIWSVRAPSGSFDALLVLREVRCDGAVLLKFCDLIGDVRVLARCGRFLRSELRRTGAEYCALDCYGVDPDLLSAAGFRAWGPEESYLIGTDPLTLGRGKIFLFTSDPSAVMFSADGDQDRPRV